MHPNQTLAPRSAAITLEAIGTVRSERLRMAGSVAAAAVRVMVVLGTAVATSTAAARAMRFTMAVGTAGLSVSTRPTGTIVAAGTMAMAATSAAAAGFISYLGFQVLDDALHILGELLELFIGKTVECIGGFVLVQLRRLSGFGQADHPDAAVVFAALTLNQTELFQLSQGLSQRLLTNVQQIHKFALLHGTGLLQQSDDAALPLIGVETAMLLRAVGMMGALHHVARLHQKMASFAGGILLPFAACVLSSGLALETIGLDGSALRFGFLNIEDFVDHFRILRHASSFLVGTGFWT